MPMADNLLPLLLGMMPTSLVLGGLGLGLFLRAYCHPWCQRGSPERRLPWWPWWFYGLSAFFFLTMAVWPIAHNRILFAAFFIVVGLLYLARMVFAVISHAVPQAASPLPPPRPAFRLALLSMVTLATALGLFLWANLKPERVIIVAAGSTGYITVRQGPGWPVSAYKYKNVLQSSHTVGWAGSAEHLLDNPYAKDNELTRYDVWVVNGPVGGLLAFALAANLYWVVRGLPGWSSGPGAAADRPRD
jgi:hypothetical protein